MTNDYAALPTLDSLPWGPYEFEAEDGSIYPSESIISDDQIPTDAIIARRLTAPLGTSFERTPDGRWKQVSGLDWRKVG